MIKLDRCECPNELNEDVKKELTNIYIKDKEKDVWNSPIIKKSIKDALTSMSYGKCAYCECKLNIEAKDITIDHFKPKVNNSDIVVEWTNLLPSCLRCNRKKNRSEVEIINPCDQNPKEYLGLKSGTYRLKALNNCKMGKDTIKVLGLNDIERVQTARLIITEIINEKLEDLLEDIEDCEKIKEKWVCKLIGILEEGLKDKSYSAVVSTNILNSDTYLKLKEIFIDKNEWNAKLDLIERDLTEICFELVF